MTRKITQLHIEVNISSNVLSIPINKNIMPEKRQSNKEKHSKTHRQSYFRQFGYEITIVILIIIGGFLLVEKSDVSAIVAAWIKNSFQFIVNGFANLVRGSFNFLASFETSDIVGILLILLALHLIFLRARKRVINNYGDVYRCPHCEHDKLQRVKRLFWHKFLGTIFFIRIKHYECKDCKKSTVTFSSLK